MPDFSKLWGHDVPDGPSQQPVPMIIKLEYYLVRCQELALWKDPKSSLVALAGIHLAFGYVATTTNTVLNLTLWALLSGKYHLHTSDLHHYIFSDRAVYNDLNPRDGGQSLYPVGALYCQLAGNISHLGYFSFVFMYLRFFKTLCDRFDRFRLHNLDPPYLA